MVWLSNNYYRLSRLSINFRVTTIELRLSNYDYRITTVELRLSNYDYWASTIKNQKSSIKNRVSKIENRVSRIETRESSFESSLEKRLTSCSQLEAPVLIFNVLLKLKKKIPLNCQLLKTIRRLTNLKFKTN